MTVTLSPNKLKSIVLTRWPPDKNRSACSKKHWNRYMALTRVDLYAFPSCSCETIDLSVKSIMANTHTQPHAYIQEHHRICSEQKKKKKKNTLSHQKTYAKTQIERDLQHYHIGENRQSFIPSRKRAHVAVVSYNQLTPPELLAPTRAPKKKVFWCICEGACMRAWTGGPLCIHVCICVCDRDREQRLDFFFFFSV